MKAVGIPEDKIGLITDIPLYDDHLQVSIKVISSEWGNKMAYEGSSKYKRQIFLFHSNGNSEQGHFDTITKMNRVLSTSYYCNTCNKAFQNRTSHNCEKWCSICGGENCPKDKEFTCPDCNMICRSYSCFNCSQNTQKRYR